MRTNLKAGTARVTGIYVSISTLALAPLAVGLARLRAKASLSRSILDRFGVAFSPHRYQPVVLPGDLHRDLGAERGITGLDLNEDRRPALIAQLRRREELLAIPLERPAGDRFGHHNGSFGSGDAVTLYDVIRRFRSDPAGSSCGTGNTCWRRS